MSDLLQAPEQHTENGRPAPAQANMQPRPALSRRIAAEAFATFGLVFCIGGAAAEAASKHANLGLPALATVSGLAVMAMIYAVGHLSGAHINPAVTVAFTLTRHFPAREAIRYVGAQLAGAAVAGLLLLAIWPDKPGHLGASAIGIGVGSALLVEVVLSALLMFVIMAVATDTRAVGAAAAIAIGGTVLLDILVGGGVSGASMNPARSFGPAVGSGDFDDFWIWVVGPLVGATLGALAYQFIRGDGVLAVAKHQALGAMDETRSPTSVQPVSGPTASVRYLVDDVADAVGFYTAYLGFRLETNALPAYAELAQGPLRLLVSGAPKAHGAESEPGSLNRIRLIVGDLPGEIARLRAAGALLYGDVVSEPSGTHALLMDPSSNLVELFQPRPSRS